MLFGVIFIQLDEIGKWRNRLIGSSLKLFLLRNAFGNILQNFSLYSL